MIEELYEQFPIMQELKDERVFSVQESEYGEIEIMECCDGWFSVGITKESAKEISNFFLELSKQM